MSFAQSNWTVTAISVENEVIVSKLFTEEEGEDALVDYLENIEGPKTVVEGRLKELDITIETKKVISDIKEKAKK